MERTTSGSMQPVYSQFAQLYSITSSAPLMSEGETSIPRILAVFTLMRSSTFVTR